MTLQEEEPLRTTAHVNVRERSLSMAHTGAEDILMGYEIFFRNLFGL